jgi:L-fuconolactonase
VMKIIDVFGVDRCMWGTDWTRATELLTYEQGVEPFRNTKRLSVPRPVLWTQGWG